MKILIVDDEPGALNVTKRMLSFYQAQVIVCLSAVEGLKQLQAHRLDVIVSDIIMPHIDGYQFIQAVRNLPAHKGKDTPALALTAFSRPQDRARAFDAGFQAHLSKPVSLEVLVETIAGMISLPDDLPN